MDTAFDSLGSVSPGKESWRFKVRVFRLWSVKSFMKPHQVHSIEMVLIDEKDVKIHATIRRQLLYLFSSKINEGNVYKLSHFTVLPASGVYRTTPHPYKLMFEMKTKVQSSSSNLIAENRLSLSTIAELLAYGPDHDFLVDVVGLITGMSSEKEYVRDERATKMVVLELTDNSGKCECALFGSYADDVQRMIGKSGPGLPMIVIQFAKIKSFQGNLSIQNVLNATRIFIDPSIPEVISFKERLAIEGVNSVASIPTIGSNAKPTFEEDFLGKYCKTSIADLVDTVVDGMYAVCGLVDWLVDPEDWWYPSCTCHRSVTADSGAYYCRQCDKHVFKMVPRYRVKLRVVDGTGEAVFVVFDNDMSALLGKPCSELVSLSKGQRVGYFPPELEILRGSKLLFKVEKKTYGSFQFDVSFRVKRICNDMSVIEAFDSERLTDEKNGIVGKFIVEEEFVAETQVNEFVENAIVSPLLQNHVEEKSVSIPEVVNLGDNDDSVVDVVLARPEGLVNDKVDSIKRNLLGSFSDCDDAPKKYKSRRVSNK